MPILSWLGIKSSYKLPIVGLSKYIHLGQEKYMKLSKDHRNENILYSIQKEAKDIFN